jgi:glycosyltransferase involved in cell wall biosynthesis
MNVLLSAYACEPDKGSEPEVGWQWAIGVAKVCSVTVLTRANNQLPIEAALQSVPPPHPKFLYYDLPKCFLALKKLGLPASIYYCLWQIGAAIFIKKHRMDFDLVQHLTFNSFLCPGFLWFSQPPIILGPLGGGMTTHIKHLNWFRWSASLEFLRSLLVKLARFNPVLCLSLHKAKHIWTANADTLANLPAFAKSKASILLETAAPPSQVSVYQPFSLTPLPLLWVGRLEPRKAPSLALEVLKRLHEKNLRLKLNFIGEGYLEVDLRAQVLDAGLTNFVSFLGRIPKERIAELMQKHLALIFSSVRDTSGNVVLEAMANGLPVVAFRHQGVVQMLNDEIGYLVRPRGSPNDVEAFTQAIEQIIADPFARQLKIGQALLRAQGELSWPAKWPEVARMYLSLYNS